MDRCHFKVIYALKRTVIAVGGCLVFCGCHYLEPVGPPFTVSVVLRDSVITIHDSLKIRVSVPDVGVWGVKYVWFVDSPLQADTTTDNVLIKVFSVTDTGMRCIVIKAVDGNGHESPPAVFYVNVIYHRPSVILHADTVASVHTFYSLSISGIVGSSPVDHFIWYVDTPLKSTVTADTVVSFIWGIADTGRRLIVVRAFDEDGVCSAPCSLQVNVVYLRPMVTLYSDTVSFSGESHLLRISGTAGENPIDRYVWYIDDSSQSRATVDTLCTWVWGEQDTGRHVLSAYAVDRGGVTSNRMTLVVTVLPGTPVIAMMHDTTISSSDTLMITCHASDPNGSIVKYLWNFSGAGWNDSTTDSSHALSYAGNGTERVVVGARDNDGLVSTAAFTVTFNRPPDTIAVSAPAQNDTLVLPEKTADCSVAFAYRSSDPDNDMIVYSLSWGPAIDSLSPVYQGTDQSARVDGVGPGLYFWRLEAQDSWGHRCVTNGTVVVIREHRICFVGHSIVLGFCADSATGGFRAGVLDSLRKTLGPYERLKAVGPATSDNYIFHLPPVDDSCMAVAGVSADILFNTMYVLPSLTADIWVLMIGVTDDYNPKGLRCTALLMDLMVGRNPDGRFYVLNANPITPSNWNANYWLPYFNQGLTDSIAARVAGGAHVFQVDAFTALSDSSGQYDSTLFVDGLHPNQSGYDRLRDVIFSTMESSDPPVIAKNP